MKIRMHKQHKSIINNLCIHKQYIITSTDQYVYTRRKKIFKIKIYARFHKKKNSVMKKSTDYFNSIYTIYYRTRQFFAAKTKIHTDKYYTNNINNTYIYIYVF